MAFGKKKKETSSNVDETEDTEYDFDFGYDDADADTDGDSDSRTEDKKRHRGTVIIALVIAAVLLVMAAVIVFVMFGPTAKGKTQTATTSPTTVQVTPDVNANPTAGESAGTETNPVYATPDFTFTATDLDGNTVTEACLLEAKLTMINFWEPWCGPCVEELPYLQALYSKYYGNGFRIIGVYSTEGMDTEVRETLTKASVTYPVIFYQPEFSRFDTGYVPTTIFVNGYGQVVWGPTAGSNTYEGWELIILELLK